MQKEQSRATKSKVDRRTRSKGTKATSFARSRLKSFFVSQRRRKEKKRKTLGSLERREKIYFQHQTVAGLGKWKALEAHPPSGQSRFAFISASYLAFRGIRVDSSLHSKLSSVEDRRQPSLSEEFSANVRGKKSTKYIFIMKKFVKSFL
jgi:hypothetical protein